MPITANSFILVNSTPQNVAKLEAALKYLQERSPDMAAPILMAAAESQVRIFFSDPAVNPHDAYGEKQHAIVWNPDEGLVVLDSKGNELGVQSPANGLFHEIAHAIDIDVATREGQANDQYENDAEAVAVIYADAVARDCGEVQRNNYLGRDIKVSNPTQHTGDDGNGHQIWRQSSSVGQEETGPAFKSGQPAPVFGSAADEHDVNSTPDAGGSNGESNRHANDPTPPVPPTDDSDGNISIPESGTGNSEDPTAPVFDPDIYPSPDAGSDGADDREDFHDGGAGCVAATSFLPDGRKAAEVKVGDRMMLGHEETLAEANGIVSFSKMKEARGYRFVTESGAALVCSETAPIPVRGKCFLTPDKLLGEYVAVYRDDAGTAANGWELVTKVEAVGVICVQHIRVGDRCFWAGEKKGAYILHHNLKDAGGDEYWPEEWDPLKARLKPDEAIVGRHHQQSGEGPAVLVGVSQAHPLDGVGMM